MFKDIDLKNIKNYVMDSFLLGKETKSSRRHTKDNQKIKVM